MLRLGDATLSQGVLQIAKNIVDLLRFPPYYLGQLRRRKMDNIEQTLERLIANWDQLHMNGTIDRAVYDAGLRDFDTWIIERRKLAVLLEYQDGIYH